ncbi:MAG: hypothetical protein ACRC2T_09740 [Thermoguttaceae bacterium]
MTTHSGKGHRPNTDNKRHKYSSQKFDPRLSPQIGALGRRGEPISLAEQIAIEQSHGVTEPTDDEFFESQNDSMWQHLRDLSVSDLISESRKYGPDFSAVMKNGKLKFGDQQEIILRIIRHRIKQKGLMFAEGTIEVLPDEFGFMRSSSDYISSLNDIYVSPTQVRRFGLRTGTVILGQIRPPKENEKYFALLRIEAINNDDPNLLKSVAKYDEMPNANSKQKLSFVPSEESLRIDDLTCEERIKAIVSLARDAMSTKSDLHVFVIILGCPLPIPQNVLQEGAEPEVNFNELNKISAQYFEEIKGPHCEAIMTWQTEPTTRHIHLCEFLLEKAKRMVEYGKDVLIILDSAQKLQSSYLLDLETRAQFPGFKERDYSPQTAVDKVRTFMSSGSIKESGGSLSIVSVQ